MTPSHQFSRQLLKWYTKHKRDLPWRHTKDPYCIWISEIMLQQTTVNAVIPYYERWIKTFPNVDAVAKAPIVKILKAWQGLGYYHRARNIHQCAKMIIRDFNGKVPDQFDILKTLPGFGPYTTGAVLSIAFDQRYPIIDANVRRVMMRYLAIQGHGDPSHDKKILNFLNEVLPKKHMSDFNQALMELGALVCRSKDVLCVLCPLRLHCRAYAKGIQEIIPQVKKKIITVIQASVGVIRSQNKVLIQKRSQEKLLTGFWEFPGGKIKHGESPLQALKREIEEELGAVTKQEKFLFIVNHCYTKFRVQLHVFDCQLTRAPQFSANRKWVTLKQIQQYPMPSGSAKIVDYLLMKGV